MSVSPNGERRTRRVVREKIRSPSSSSSLAIEFERAACVTPHVRAARLKEPALEHVLELGERHRRLRDSIHPHVGRSVEKRGKGGHYVALEERILQVRLRVLL
jgi:hypothetical protein